MFRKNYDKEIEDLYKKIYEIVKSQNRNQETLLQMIKGIQRRLSESLLEIAKIQKSHKEAIMLLSKKDETNN